MIFPTQRISCFPVCCNAVVIVDKLQILCNNLLKDSINRGNVSGKRNGWRCRMLHDRLYKLKKYVCQRMSIYAIFMQFIQFLFPFLFPIFNKKNIPKNCVIIYKHLYTDNCFELDSCLQNIFDLHEKQTPSIIILHIHKLKESGSKHFLLIRIVKIIAPQSQTQNK